MRFLIMAALTMAGYSSSAYAERILVLNCVFGTNEADVVKTLKTLTILPTGGVEVGDIRTGIAAAQLALVSGKMETLNRSAQRLSVINSAKIVRLETHNNDYKNVCAILEGDRVN